MPSHSPPVSTPVSSRNPVLPLRWFRALFPFSSPVLAFTGIGLILIGLFSSNLIMSIGTIWVLVLSVVDDDPLNRFRQILAHPVWLSLVLVFLVYVFGGIGGQETTYWLGKLQVKLPFLVLPLAFAALPGLNRRLIHWVLLLFLAIVSISALVLSARFLVQPESLSQSYIQGMTMPTPLNHIRYSLIVSFGLATALWYRVVSGQKVAGEMPLWCSLRWARWLFGGIALLLFVFLHLLAVRSGLLGGYLVLFCFLVYGVVTRRQWLAGAGTLILAVLGLWAAVQFVPTLRNRVSYARYDLEQFRKGEANPGLSDAKRIGSILAGWELFREHPLTGVGIGQVRPALQKIYQRDYPDLAANIPLPHNQFVLVAACTGLLGLIFFSWALLAPWTVPGILHNPLFVSLQVIVFSSMITEATLETQLGLTFYLLFTLLLIRFHLPESALFPAEPAFRTKTSRGS